MSTRGSGGGPRATRRADGPGHPRHDAPDSPLTAWLRAMPKAELHLHLDGSLRPATALELAAERRVWLDADDLPGDLGGMRARLVAPPACRDQAELLRAFDLPVALLQDGEALERVAGELVEDVARDGTRYVEVRWAPTLHTDRGLGLRDGIAAVVRGAAAGSRATGVTARLIVVALRTHAPQLAVQMVRAALGLADDVIVGFDLAGLEHESPDPTSFTEAFDAAREGGLGISCHAGEWGGAAQVRAALAVEPWRIAHGAPAADDPGLAAELRERGVTLDLCPTSNRQAGIGLDDARAPLPRLVRAGVPVTVSTDDRTVSDLDLVRELAEAVTRLGLSVPELLGCVRHAFVAAFLHRDEGRRAALLAEHDAWVAAHPRPG